MFCETTFSIEFLGKYVAGIFYNNRKVNAPSVVQGNQKYFNIFTFIFDRTRLSSATDDICFEMKSTMSFLKSKISLFIPKKDQHIQQRDKQQEKKRPQDILPGFKDESVHEGS